MLGFAIFLSTAAVVIIIVFTAVYVHDLRHPPRRGAAYALAHRLPADPGELDLEVQWEEWMIHREAGIDLRAWRIRANKSTSEPDLTAVLLHDDRDSRYTILPEAPAWLGLFTQIIIVDRRGHGDSSGPSTLGANEARDVETLLARIESPEIVLIGFGAGAEIAVRAAAALGATQSPLRAIVAVDPPPPVRERIAALWRAEHRPVWPFLDLALLYLRITGVKAVGSGRNTQIGLPLLVISTNDDAAARERARDFAARASAAHLETLESPREAKAPDIVRCVRSFLKKDGI